MTIQKDTPPSLTRFVAFYSYKGGVGRTLALANCARALVAKGKKIVLLDFDLEAPGLLHFDVFRPKNGGKNPAGFVEYLDACLREGPPDSLDEYIHRCLGLESDQGQAWLMPAGRHREAGYMDFLNGMTWSDFYSQQNGYKVLENFRGHIIEQFAPDYVFIDARTGLSEMGGIATHQLADIVVLVFNLNGQNLDGAKWVFDSIRKAALQPKVILVASPVPVMSMDKGTPFAKKMEQIKKNFAGAVNNEKPLVIPYHPLLAFDDRLLVDDGDMFSSDVPYLRLVDTIQEVAEVDAEVYLQQMAKFMQQGDWQQVLVIGQHGLAKNPTDIYLLVNLATAHYFTGDLEKALNSLDQLLQLHMDTPELAKQQLVIQALIRKGFTLGQLQRPEEALNIYDDLLRRFGNSELRELQIEVAGALFDQGSTFAQLQRLEEAVTVYNQLLLRFGDAQESEIQEAVAGALNGIGFALLSEAKRCGSVHEQQSKFAEAVSHFEDGLQRTTTEHRRAILLGNKGYVLFLLGRVEESKALLKEALGLRGEVLYQEELMYSSICEMPKDIEFRALLKQLWDEVKETMLLSSLD